jgi:predicted dehydrogenase
MDDPVRLAIVGCGGMGRRHLAGLLALEYDELARCVRTGQQPEVTGAVALRDVALVYALFESNRARRPVTIQEVEDGAVDAHQREIDQQLGLLEPTVAVR